MRDERHEAATRNACHPPGRTSRLLPWLAGLMVAGVAHASAQVPEPSLPRPGAVVVQDLIGEATAVAGDQRKPVKAEERLRVGSTIMTERMSLVTLILSNGTRLRLGSESELEVEEFGQATIPSGTKFAELKEEPTVSRTRLRLERGDVMVDLKRLNASRGSSFMLSLVAGTVRSTEGIFHVRMRMSDLGLGVCTLEVEKGAAEFEPLEGKFAPLPVGRQVVFAIEIDRITGTPKVSEMPKEAPKAATAK
ncbi:MAG: hypothetical protein ACREH8_06390 [Opitutaceae bacterium]